ncbi:MAG: RIP metalloprotease RseP [Flavobacteriales bacterium]|nr:RIP metalloprotease RseP [Flavobacteriales bacterium]
MILALQLLLSLSILIVLHELGHFIPAKLFKTRVEKFYLFFDPWFSLVKKKVGDTVYGIGWLPLGGYVKISGMVDESMDKDQMALPPQPWEFRAKPAWQRLIIMVGGVTVNVILGILIYGLVLWHWGQEVIPVDKMQHGVFCDPYMLEIGFKDGDKILALDGEKLVDFNIVNKLLLLNDVQKVTIERDGKQMDIALPAGLDHELVRKGVKMSFQARIYIDNVVDSVLADTPAMRAGLQKGDSVISINNIPVSTHQETQRIIGLHRNFNIDLEVKRGGETKNLILEVSKKGTIGYGVKQDRTKLPRVDTLHYTLAQAIPGGFKEAWSTITDYAVSLKFIFSKAGAKQMGGFITIAKIFPNEWNWWAFWEKTAFISLVLAFMNILPIPALDGGHVMFLIWEVITGKAVSQKILEGAQMVGMVLLLGLLLYANGMDFLRLATD